MAGAQPHAGAVIVEEFDSPALQCYLDLVQRTRLRIYRRIEGLHAADGADGHVRGFCELCLIPSQERTGRP